MYISSSNIRMYPSSKRDDAFDRNARLTSEQNLISFSNRLTSKDSYILNGLNIGSDTSNNTAIKTGECVIHGYLFNITSDINIESILGDNNQNKYLCLQIVTQTIQIENPSYGQTEYEELIAYETNNPTDNILDSLDQQAQGSSSNFTGLIITTKSSIETAEIEGNYNYWYLIIAEWDDSNNTWVTYQNVSNYNSDILYDINKTKILDKDIQVSIDIQNNYGGQDYNVAQNLSTWLQYNYAIDDGVIN